MCSWMLLFCFTISNPTTITMCTHGSSVTGIEHGKMTLSICFEITQNTPASFSIEVSIMSQ